MIEILITSSLLILVIMGARALFRGKVKQKLIYGMWLLAALRLLIPVQFGNFDFSILKAAQPVTETVTQISKAPVSGPSREDVYFDTVHGMIKEEQSVFIPEVQEKVDAELEQEQADPFEVYDKYLQSHPESLTPEVQTKVEENIAATVTAPTFGQIATVVWMVGSVMMAVWFVFVNLRHRKLLRQNRVKLDDAGSPIPVYISPGATSPCLTGLMRPVIYLTPASAATEESKRHVLAHELTHWRHMDELWSLVRCLCLCIYWFHPLVWLAAWMSRRDCELACDESALEKLGENERIPYGKTLLAVVEQSRSPVHLMQTATSMNETKKQLTERVNLIVKKPKVFLTAAILLILLCAIAAGCAFAGHSADNPTGDTTPSTEATDTGASALSFTYRRIRNCCVYPSKPYRYEMIHTAAQLSDLVENSKQNVSGNYKESLKKYDDTFFADHTLVMVFFAEGSTDIDHVVSDVQLNDHHDIEITIQRLGLDGTLNAMMGYWTILIEIDSKLPEDTCCLIEFTDGSNDDDSTEPSDPTHIHAYNNQQVIAPSCEEEGYTLLICDCGATKQTAPQLKTGHDFVSVKVVEPTCTEAGYNLMACRRCEKELEEVKPAKGHDNETVKIVFPTEDEKEHIERTCHCGEVSKDFEAPLYVKFTQDAKGYLYCCYKSSSIQSDTLLLVDEPVVESLFVRDDRNVCYVKVAEPSKIYCVSLIDVSEPKVLYESLYGGFTEFNPDDGQDGSIQIVENGKRFILLDLTSGDIRVVFEAYSLLSAEAYFNKTDGSISHVWLRGQPTENHKSTTYFYYPATNKFVEHTG